MVSDQFESVIGVDTHRDTLSAAILNRQGVVKEIAVRASDEGYQTLLDAANVHAGVSRIWAIEGTRSYGLGLTRFLQARAEKVGEIEVPQRVGRKRGKSDRIDAERAAREAWGKSKLAEPRSDGEREALRILDQQRQQLVNWRTEATNQIGNLLLGLPSQLRSRFNLNGSHAWERMLKVAAKLESGADSSFEERVRIEAIVDFAEKAQAMEKEAAVLEQRIQQLVSQMAPQLLAEPGVGPVTGARILIAWSHQGRIHSEAAFARLAGVAPLEASSGQFVRHRLNRLGDRTLNSALQTIVLSRRRYHDETKAYVAKKAEQRKNSREINRCLKRYLARRFYRLLETPPS